MIPVVITCNTDKLKISGIGIFIRYGIAFMRGILYKITYTMPHSVDSKKYAIDKNIDCII